MSKLKCWEIWTEYGQFIFNNERDSTEFFSNELTVVHRENKPAETYFENGKILSESYVIYGFFHREPGSPSNIEYDCTTGEIIFETYHVNGNCHREDGPYYCDYINDDYEYALHDIGYEKEQWQFIKENLPLNRIEWTKEQLLIYKFQFGKISNSLGY